MCSVENDTGARQSPGVVSFGEKALIARRAPKEESETHFFLAAFLAAFFFAFFFAFLAMTTVSCIRRHHASIDTTAALGHRTL